ncbi:MAG: flagellar hook-associated protein FlgK [Rhodospirillales bacterium RIFCSPLOWO2_12_FULL_67_15]|nr:MAG: flagellar hook-associated protein FlgK [Rhodospirillales bacterium RIFCSPLOWO2_12_FULL_67_15]
MAGDITLALRTVQSGLLASQSALNTVANNISNVNTPAYSRKIVNLETRVIAGTGAGVQISDITRQVDEGLLRSMRRESSTLQGFDSQISIYDRLQDLFGAPADNNSFAHITQDFATAAEMLVVSPNRFIEQSNLVRWAQQLTESLHAMTATIQELRLQADIAIGEHTDRINKLIVRIGDLNDSLIANSTTGRDVSDFRDQRDAVVDELASLIDIRYFTRSDGDVVVYTTNGRTLVDKIPGVLSHDVASTTAETMSHAGGQIDGLYIGDKIAGNDLTNSIRGGKLKGLIEARDQVLPKLQSELDHFAAMIRDTVNQVHNRGVPFPGLQSMTGTRTFVEPASQTIKLDPTSAVDDVTIALFNSTGDQSAVTTLNTIMVAAGFANYGAWKINDVASTLQSWLQANGAATATVAVNALGKFAINLSQPSLGLAFRDQTASANGSTHQDAEIGFDANFDGTVDATVYGFSNFFGLNDFFTDNLADNIHESDVITGTFSSGAATLVFRDSNAQIGASLIVPAGTSLQGIADLINNNYTKLTAAVVPDGAGNRLRIAHANGSSFTITQSAGSLLGTLGMHVSDIRTASALAVRDDIVLTPSLISRGTVQWNPDLGAAGLYYTSLGDDSAALMLAQALNTNVAFKTAGHLGALTTSFSGYATQVLAENSNRADNNASDAELSKLLFDSLKTKSDNVRGVNLDEEMSSLLLFQQSYAAAARVVSVIQRMFDALNAIIP